MVKDGKGSEGPRAHEAGLERSEAWVRLAARYLRDLPQQLDGVIIDYAELVFTATPDTGSGYICLMGAYPVTKAWKSANLSWSEAWTNTGGDYADSIYSTGVIRTSTDRPTRMDKSITNAGNRRKGPAAW